MMLIGDSAGLSYPQSGEGIRPAVESGLLAADTIIAADGNYDSEHLEPYRQSTNR
jgi:flavin-dependent dehydrogenase